MSISDPTASNGFSWSNRPDRLIMTSQDQEWKLLTSDQTRNWIQVLKMAGELDSHPPRNEDRITDLLGRFKGLGLYDYDFYKTSEWGIMPDRNVYIDGLRYVRYNPSVTEESKKPHYAALDARVYRIDGAQLRFAAEFSSATDALAYAKDRNK